MVSVARGVVAYLDNCGWNSEMIMAHIKDFSFICKSTIVQKLFANVTGYWIDMNIYAVHPCYDLLQNYRDDKFIAQIFCVK